MTELKKNLLQQLHLVEKSAAATKWNRLQHNPSKYLQAVFAKLIKYGVLHKATQVTCKAFWGSNITVLLPSSSDIFLNGGKTHFSEIKLCKFLILHTSNADSFLDIGAHIGYFSLLMQRLLPTTNSINCIEPSKKTFAMLHANCNSFKNMQLHHCLLGNKIEQVQFYEFPELYAENNTANISQFENTTWINKNKPSVSDINMNTADELLAKYNILPTIIKIDVEGSEHIVIQGMQQLIASHAPIIIMEFFHESKNNASHCQAENILLSYGYKNFSINDDGNLQQIETTTTQYFTSKHILSDNIVYLKK
jgi:FkbM family methyltransferase